MNIIQEFYDNLAQHYDKLFSDWEAESDNQAQILQRLFSENGFDKSAQIHDCACGIGTQAIGLGKLGYNISASDISGSELAEAAKRAVKANVGITLQKVDFRALAEVFEEEFDIIIAMDNALPHMLTKVDLESAVKSIANRLRPGGMFVASIRDYDALLVSKPPYSPPYIHNTAEGRRVSFQTWDWKGDNYRLTQYIIEDEAVLRVNKFDCEYRAITREELSELLCSCGCREVRWLMPEESGFYQPVVIARK